VRAKTAFRCLLVLSVWPAIGQTPPVFEVASIRRNLSGDPHDAGINILPGGRISGTNLSLKTLIWQAYNTIDFRLKGGPGWIETERYDIQAKTANGENITLEQMEPLLQRLLADRFKLSAHWETRDTPVYALVIDKNGSKLKEDPSGPGRLLNTAFNRRQVLGKARITGTGASMGSLVVSLTNVLDRIVLDQTGLMGKYDFMCEWELDQSLPDASGPSLFTGLREQLGLRLESQKAPVEMLVIDSAERASEN
jgi:uncharacterized protein (TIGR03435 family)